MQVLCTSKHAVSGVRFGGFLRVIRELQIENDGFKSAVLVQLKANVFGCLDSLSGDVLPSAAQWCRYSVGVMK